MALEHLPRVSHCEVGAPPSPVLRVLVLVSKKARILKNLGSWHARYEHVTNRRPASAGVEMKVAYLSRPHASSGEISRETPWLQPLPWRTVGRLRLELAAGERPVSDRLREIVEVRFGAAQLLTRPPCSPRPHSTFPVKSPPLDGYAALVNTLIAASISAWLGPRKPEPFLATTWTERQSPVLVLISTAGYLNPERAICRTEMRSSWSSDKVSVCFANDDRPCANRKVTPSSVATAHPAPILFACPPVVLVVPWEKMNPPCASAFSSAREHRTAIANHGRALRAAAAISPTPIGISMSAFWVGDTSQGTTRKNAAVMRQSTAAPTRDAPKALLSRTLLISLLPHQSSVGLLSGMPGNAVKRMTPVVLTPIIAPPIMSPPAGTKAPNKVDVRAKPETPPKRPRPYLRARRRLPTKPSTAKSRVGHASARSGASPIINEARRSIHGCSRHSYAEHKTISDQ